MNFEAEIIAIQKAHVKQRKKDDVL